MFGFRCVEKGGLLATTPKPTTAPCQICPWLVTVVYELTIQTSLLDQSSFHSFEQNFT